MATQSSANLDELVGVLAEQAVYNAEYRRMQKEGTLSDSLQQLGSSAFQTLRDSPTLGAGVLGAGLGGAYGLASNLYGNEERKRPIRGAISGALAGGALGAGAGLAGKQLHSYLQNRPTPTVMPAGRFTMGGKAYDLQPGAEKAMPELSDLESRSPVTRAVGGVTDALSGYAKKHPILASIMGVDAASHLVGTGAEMTNAGRGGSATRGHLDKAIKGLKPGDGKTTMGENEIKGLGRLFSKQRADSVRKSYIELIRGGGGISMQGAAAKGGKPGGRTSINANDLKDVGRAGTGVIRPGGIRSMLDILETVAGKKNPGQSLDWTGYGDENKYIGAPIKALLQKLRVNPTRAGRIGMGVGNAAQGAIRGLGNLPRPTSGLARLGGRAGLYGGIPALQWYMGQSAQESSARARINELLKQYAVPAGQ